MLTTTEIQSRCSKAVNALNEKMNTIESKVTFSSVEPNMQRETMLGTVAITLASKGTSIEPETFTRTFAMLVTVASQFGTEFDTLFDDDEEELYAAEIIRFANMNIPQLMLDMAVYLPSLIEENSTAFGFHCAAHSLICFCIMHGMNEQEIINAIPETLEARF